MLKHPYLSTEVKQHRNMLYLDIIIIVDGSIAHNLHLMAGRLAPAAEIAGGHILPFKKERSLPI
jgi:predicted NBD/HSP70 family sugar kinase